jgi:Flp pilus assembly protein TadG
MQRSGRRAQGDAGAGLVEFAFVAVLLLTLVFGIIQFGLILNFKQDMTRAAAEGARAGAVALPTGTQTPADAAEAAADEAVHEAVAAFGGGFSSADPYAAGKGCQRTGMTCEPAVVAACDAEPALECVTVAVEYDYGSHPLYGEVPLISAFLPDTVRAESVARINP